jgi:hypothetical protein
LNALWIFEFVQFPDKSLCVVWQTSSHQFEYGELVPIASLNQWWNSVMKLEVIKRRQVITTTSAQVKIKKATLK